jgi:peptidoglycan-N-acetylglucosamine deacetylase
MNRREFTKTIGMGAAALGLGTRVSLAKDGPQIAITMDDFNWNKSVKLEPEERNRAILEALQSQGSLKAALFVAGKNVESEKGKALLGAWDRAGQLIGNHSYSHKYLNSSKVTAEIYTADILKCEESIKGFAGFKSFFAFPI